MGRGSSRSALQLCVRLRPVDELLDIRVPVAVQIGRRIRRILWIEVVLLFPAVRPEGLCRPQRQRALPALRAGGGSGGDARGEPALGLWLGRSHGGPRLRGPAGHAGYPRLSRADSASAR